MSIFEKHVEQDKVAGEWLLEYPKLWTNTNPGAINIYRPGMEKWRTMIYDIMDNLPEHLAEFIRFRQEVGNVRYWCGPVAGKYAAAGLPTPTRLTMHRYWKAIVNETVRLALKEGLL